MFSFCIPHPLRHKVTTMNGEEKNPPVANDDPPALSALWHEAILSSPEAMRDIAELQAKLRERNSRLQPWQYPTPEAVTEMKANGTWIPDGTFMDSQPRGDDRPA